MTLACTFSFVNVLLDVLCSILHRKCPLLPSVFSDAIEGPSDTTAPTRDCKDETKTGQQRKLAEGTAAGIALVLRLHRARSHKHAVHL